MISFGASLCALIPKIIPALSAARHLLVKFASRSGFIAAFLLETLDDTGMIFSLDFVPYFIMEKMLRDSCALCHLVAQGRLAFTALTAGTPSSSPVASSGCS